MKLSPSGNDPSLEIYEFCCTKLWRFRFRDILLRPLPVNSYHTPQNPWTLCEYRHCSSENMHDGALSRRFHYCWKRIRLQIEWPSTVEALEICELFCWKNPVDNFERNIFLKATAWSPHDFCHQFLRVWRVMFSVTSGRSSSKYHGENVQKLRRALFVALFVFLGIYIPKRDLSTAIRPSLLLSELMASLFTDWFPYTTY